jgi:hypothetical protein
MNHIYYVFLLEIHQKEMLQKGILKSLVHLLDHANPQLRSKALEVVQYFDSTLFFHKFFFRHHFNVSFLCEWYLLFVVLFDLNSQVSGSNRFCRNLETTFGYTHDERL